MRIGSLRRRRRRRTNCTQCRGLKRIMSLRKRKTHSSSRLFLPYFVLRLEPCPPQCFVLPLLLVLLVLVRCPVVLRRSVLLVLVLVLRSVVLRSVVLRRSVLRRSVLRRSMLLLLVRCLGPYLATAMPNFVPRRIQPARKIWCSASTWKSSRTPLRSGIFLMR